MKTNVKFTLICIMIAIVALSALIIPKIIIGLGLQEYFKHAYEASPALTTVVYIALSVITTVTFIPFSMVSTVAHGVFGYQTALGVSFVIYMVSTVCIYLVAKYLRKSGFVTHILGTKMRKFNRVGKSLLMKNWFLTAFFVFSTRYVFVAYLCGISGVRFGWLISTVCAGQTLRSIILIYRDTLLGINDTTFTLISNVFVALSVFTVAFIILISYLEVESINLRELFRNRKEVFSQLVHQIIPKQ
jgi:uncharacterized membrane protein YdjX (TVP38/TMEM64 family)